MRPHIESTIVNCSKLGDTVVHKNIQNSLGIKINNTFIYFNRSLGDEFDSLTAEVVNNNVLNDTIGYGYTTEDQLCIVPGPKYLAWQTKELEKANIIDNFGKGTEQVGSTPYPASGASWQGWPPSAASQQSHHSFSSPQYPPGAIKKSATAHEFNNNGFMPVQSPQNMERSEFSNSLISKKYRNIKGYILLADEKLALNKELGYNVHQALYGESQRIFKDLHNNGKILYLEKEQKIVPGCKFDPNDAGHFEPESGKATNHGAFAIPSVPPFEEKQGPYSTSHYPQSGEPGSNGAHNKAFFSMPFQTTTDQSWQEFGIKFCSLSTANNSSQDPSQSTKVKLPPSFSKKTISDNLLTIKYSTWDDIESVINYANQVQSLIPSLKENKAFQSCLKRVKNRYLESFVTLPSGVYKASSLMFLPENVTKVNIEDYPVSDLSKLPEFIKRDPRLKSLRIKLANEKMNMSFTQHIKVIFDALRDQQNIVDFSLDLANNELKVGYGEEDDEIISNDGFKLRIEHLMQGRQEELSKMLDDTGTQILKGCCHGNSLDANLMTINQHVQSANLSPQDQSALLECLGKFINGEKYTTSQGIKALMETFKNINDEDDIEYIKLYVNIMMLYNDKKCDEDYPHILPDIKVAEKCLYRRTLVDIAHQAPLLQKCLKENNIPDGSKREYNLSKETNYPFFNKDLEISELQPHEQLECEVLSVIDAMLPPLQKMSEVNASPYTGVEMPPRS